MPLLSTPCCKPLTLRFAKGSLSNRSLFECLGKNYPRSLRFQAPARPSALLAHARDFSRAPSLMKPWGFGNLLPAPSFLPHILLILLHTLSCSCLRLCFRKVAQVSLSAVELPGHLFVPALPASCLVFFFATKKKTRRPCDCFVIPLKLLMHLWIRLSCNKSRPGNVVYGLDCSMAET